MKKIYLILEHRQSALVRRLQSEITELRCRLDGQVSANAYLEQRFGYEVMLNSELIDLCNQYNVPYREHLDFKKYSF